MIIVHVNSKIFIKCGLCRLKTLTARLKFVEIIFAHKKGALYLNYSVFFLPAAIGSYSW